MVSDLVQKSLRYTDLCSESPHPINQLKCISRPYCIFSQNDNFFQPEPFTLESGIDVGHGITVGPGKFVKKNKRRALNKRRA